MITFFRIEGCRQSDAIQEALEEMSLAHQVVRLSSAGQRHAGLPEGISPPALLDDGQCFEGYSAILRRLEQLREFKADWERFQSDACYCDDDGNAL